MNESETMQDHFVRLLNALLAVDPEGTQALFDHRVEVSLALASDESAVLEHVVLGDRGDEPPTLGLLGILNGLLGASGGMAAFYDDDGRIMRFEVNERPEGLPPHRWPPSCGGLHPAESK